MSLTNCTDGKVTFSLNVTQTGSKCFANLAGKIFKMDFILSLFLSYLLRTFMTPRSPLDRYKKLLPKREIFYNLNAFSSPEIAFFGANFDNKILFLK